MSFSQAQPVTVTLTADTQIRVSTIPAVNTQTTQLVGISLEGEDQTVVTQPSE